MYLNFIVELEHISMCLALNQESDTSDLRASPTPVIVMLLPRTIELLYVLSWAAAPTVKIHGLKEEMLLGDGPVFPAAWTTKIPDLTAESKAMSIGLKKVAIPGGRLFGVIDKLIMSTPSCAAYKCKNTRINDLRGLEYTRWMLFGLSNW